MLALIDELGIDRPLVVGYDVGSRVARELAVAAPDRIRGLVIGPPLPGAADRVLTADAQREFWYQAFHQLALAPRLLDGNAQAVRAYLGHFWSHWSGSAFLLPQVELERLVDLYSRPGARASSIGWYRAGSGRSPGSGTSSRGRRPGQCARR